MKIRLKKGKKILKLNGLKINGKVDFLQEKQKRKHKTFEERWQSFQQLSLSEIERIEDYDWGKDLGKEQLD